MGRFTNWLRGGAVQTKDIFSTPGVSISPELIEEIQFGGLGDGYSLIYRTQPSVYSVVEFLAWQIAGIGLKPYRRTSDNDRESLSGSELDRLIQEPAPGLTTEELLHTTVADMGVFGNSYWAKLEAGGERAVMPLPPQKVTPEGGSIVQAGRYRVEVIPQRAGAPAVNRFYTADEVAHFHRYNPDDRRVGVSPLEPLRWILREEAESTRARADMFANSARIGGVIEQDIQAPPLGDAQKVRFRADWQNVHAGRGKTGKTAVLEPGMRFKETSWSPQEAEFIAGRKLALETVARAFNVPVSLLGLTETATFASAQEFHKQLYVDTLGPYLRTIEAKINQTIVPWITDDPAVYVEFNVEEKLRGDFAEQAASIRNTTGVPFMAVNETRPFFNLPKIDDPDFDVPVKPANIIYGGAQSPGEAPAPEVRRTGDRQLAVVKEITPDEK